MIRVMYSHGGANWLNLSHYGDDLSAMARADRLRPLIARENEIQRIISILSSRGPNSVLVTGPPGCGKTALIEGLAQQLANSPDASLNRLELFQLDLTSLVAGTMYRGQLEERYATLLRILKNDTNLVLVIDEAHQISQSFSSEGASFAEVIKPALARGEITIIAITTINAWNSGPGRDSALDRRFTRIELGEMTPEDTLQVLKKAVPEIAGPTASIISDDILEYMIEASGEIIGRALPDRAMQVLREAVAGMDIPAASSTPSDINPLIDMLAEEIRLLELGEYAQARELILKYRRIRASSFQPAISREDVQAAVAKLTGSPPWEHVRSKVAQLEDALQERIIGQRPAISAVCRVLRRAVVGLKSNLRPIGGFLFIGPTGVGKTEICRGIADSLFDGQLIRIDMSEYSEEHSISRLIGSPPGYTGHEEGGILTSAIAEKPFSLVVFDEFEKAHSKVHRLLLQLFEEGCLTDGRGQQVSFSRAIIVLTSNFGSAELLDVSPGAWAESYEEIKKEMLEALMRAFSPELVNRLDDVVLFTPLGEQECAEVMDLLLASCVKLIADEHGITVEISPEAKASVLSKGYNPVLGARPLRRAIETHIVDAISEGLLDGSIAQGAKVVFDLSEAGGIEFHVVA